MKPDLPAEILSDGRTVWVNGPDGSCLGRFSRFGIDVHRTFDEQLDGKSQCLACTHGLPDPEDWLRFVALMDHHYAVAIDDAHKPAFIAEAELAMSAPGLS